MKFKEKRKHKKKKWEWILEIIDVVDIIGQILWWLLRGLFRLISKLIE